MFNEAASDEPARYTSCMPRYILPSTDWAPLLKTIVKDAQPGAIIETHTSSMYDLVMDELRAVGRSDIEVRLLSRERKAPTPDQHG